MSDVLSVYHANVILKQFHEIEASRLLVLSSLYKVERKQSIARGKLLMKHQASLSVFQVKWEAEDTTYYEGKLCV
jgi:hypothetical protein